MSEKLHKILAHKGLGSRRQIEEWIKAGRISVNGKIATVGLRVNFGDLIKVNGKRIQYQQPKASTPEKLSTQVLIYHKLAGEICSKTSQGGEPTVFDHLPKNNQSRWVSIGRLDLNTAGLLLMTNNGELAYRMMHPKFQIEREYAVRVFGEVTQEMIRHLLIGVDLEDGLAKFEKITFKGGKGINSWYHVILKEGKNREIRRLWISQGIQVSRLIRIRYGNIQLPRNLPGGKWRQCSRQQIIALANLVNMEPSHL